MEKKVALETLSLFGVLDEKLIELLQSLSEEEWDAQTIAKLWKVKDVAAHLLDGNLRGLSISRDKYFVETPGNINSYEDLVGFLNNLNLSWTNAAKRLSPQVLVHLLEITGQQYINHLHSLDPFADAVFSVAWAGQDVSPNWFHIAREYTEKFLHQQQIRDAVNKPGIMTRELFHPFIDTLMHAFPHAFRNINANTGTIVSIIIDTEIGGRWSIIKNDTGWTFLIDNNCTANATVSIQPDTAWKLFSKSWRAKDVTDKVSIDGDLSLGMQVLEMVAVMA